MQAEIMRMRQEGHSFAYMAQTFGYSETYMRKLFDQGLKKIIAPEADKVRVQEAERLDYLHDKAMRLFEKEYLMVSSGKVVSYTREVEGEDGELDVEKVLLKDVAPKLQAMDRILKIMERRAKLLGLDMPTKIAPTDPSGEKAFEIILTPQDEAL
jgi:hypothetical protein